VSAPGPTEAVRKSATVRCSLEAAFRTWVEQINAWWPKEHSMSGDPDTTISIEGKLGGRIFERTPDGVEYDWGKVAAWDPPRHLAFEWYLGSASDRPTVVDVHFSPIGEAITQIDISHRGPELIGEMWSRNSQRYDAAWGAVLAAYTASHDSIGNIE
jgi:hypothetical protein